MVLVLFAALALTIGVASASGHPVNAELKAAPPAAKGPDPVLSTVTVDRTVAAADGNVTVNITITALDSKGHPVPKWSARVIVRSDDDPTGEDNTVVQPGETDKRGVATAQLRSTRGDTKDILVSLSQKGTTVALAHQLQVVFVAWQALKVQVYQSQVGATGNCFRHEQGNMLVSPVSNAWNSSGVQPKGGYTTWLRALAQDSNAPHDWQEVTGFVSWSVLDSDGTGTTFDAATGRVTTGAGIGAVHLAVSAAGLTSPTGEGTLRVADAMLNNLHINPADDEDANSSSFGPDPIYVAAGNTAPAGVTGVFSGADAGGYCITWDTTLSSNQSTVAGVDANGVVAALSPGTATVTARKGTTISDRIPVNVGNAELQSVDVLPPTPSVTCCVTSVGFTAIGHFTDGTTADLTCDPHTTWSSSAPSVADVFSCGLATAASPGTTTITATVTADAVEPTGTVIQIEVHDSGSLTVTS